MPQTVKRKRMTNAAAALILSAAVVVIETYLWNSRKYYLTSVIMILLAMLPFFTRFERKRPQVCEIVLLAVMTALAVAGRAAFYWAPQFKPVCAIVILTAAAFNAEAGFITGAASGLISNMFFGQGPWTPFQMVSWGLIGFIAGLLANPLKRSSILLAVYGLFSGALFSLLMDTWTVLWQDGYFNLARYGAYVLSSLPWMAVYALSNVIFLLLFTPLVGKLMTRVKTKYGL